MRKRVLATTVAIVLTIAGFMVAPKVAASPADEYTGTHFGLGNIPAGCEGDSFKNNADDPAPRLDNVCYHMRTGMNGLDSSDVDVLIMVPASPTATRDMRIIKQAVDMWQGGIHYLAPQMGVPWMKNMKFHISTTIEDAAAGQGFVTYPVVDPEIVIVASNPVGGAGIGIDPWATYPGAITGQDMPCTGVSNPFDMDTWKGMPGYDHHGHEDGATVTEDCGGAGGNICFALTPAIDPTPPSPDVFNLFDLVSHEFGHCLTIGHVGDGAEAQTEGGEWSKVPTTDIMSYNQDPPGLNKCVSTLDVEGIAVTQSHYIDTNGDGVVDAHDHVDANEKDWDVPFESGGDHFQVQHPRDHFYASGTGAPTDCPQPDLGLLPGTPTNWQPTPVPTGTNTLTVTSPQDGAVASDGAFDVTGTVEHQGTGGTPPPPSSTTARFNDGASDGLTPMTEILGFDAASTATDVVVTLDVSMLPPTGTNFTSPATYDVSINGRQFESFVDLPLAGSAATFDEGAGQYVPTDGGPAWSTWDMTANTVTFSIPRAYLADAGISAPYFIKSQAILGVFGGGLIADHAPDGGDGVGIAGDSAHGFIGAPQLTSFDTVQFGDAEHNHFDTEESQGDARPVLQAAGNDTSHYYTLPLAECSNATFTLAWADATGAADLDMYVTGDGVDSGIQSASGANPETFTVQNHTGPLTVEVAPYLVPDPTGGVDYTLSAVTSAATGCTTGGGGTPPPATPNEFVHVFLDDATTPLASQAVDTSAGPDDFAVPVQVPTGDHTLRVEWEWWGRTVATKSVHVSTGAPETTTTSTSTTSTTVAGHPGKDGHPGPGDHPGNNAGIVPGAVKR